MIIPSTTTLIIVYLLSISVEEECGLHVYSFHHHPDNSLSLAHAYISVGGVQLA